MWFNRGSMKTLGLALGLLLGAAVGVSGCGTEASEPEGMGGNGGSGGSGVRVSEPCAFGVAECVSDTVGRVCPEGDEPGWVYFACGDTEVCDMGTCVLDESQAGRLGLCLAGEKQCVSDALARQCSLGGDSWLPLACRSGTVCSDGDCVPVEAGAPIQICTPQSFECATEWMARVCVVEGTSWTIFGCAGGCSAGTCSTIPIDASTSVEPDAGGTDAAPPAGDASDGG
jgi:hypothetical protein